MKRRAVEKQLLTFSLCSLVIATAAAASAHAATIRIGAVAEVAEAMRPSDISAGGFAVQAAESSGSYAVPEGYGVITSWSHSTGSVSGTLAFKVYRPTGMAREYRVVASDVRVVRAGTVETFPVSIPVEPGDRIGLSSDDVELAFESGAADDRIGFFGADPADGTTRRTDGNPFPEFRLDVAATVEPVAPPPPPPAPGPPPTAYALPPDPSPSPGPAVVPVAPVLSALRITPTVLRSSVRVGFRVDRAARVIFTVRRRVAGRRSRGRCVAATRGLRAAPRCTRSQLLPGRFARKAAAGENAFRFRGRLRGRRLRAGRYLLVATPSAGGTTGRSVTAPLRIRRR